MASGAWLASGEHSLVLLRTLEPVSGSLCLGGGTRQLWRSLLGAWEGGSSLIHGVKTEAWQREGALPRARSQGGPATAAIFSRPHSLDVAPAPGQGLYQALG